MAKQFINKTAAFNLIKNTKGHFFGVTFTERDGSKRVMNAQYSKRETNPLGYVLLRDTNIKDGTSGLRNVNLQTISELKISGITYKVK